MINVVWLPRTLALTSSRALRRADLADDLDLRRSGNVEQRYETTFRDHLVSNLTAPERLAKEQFTGASGADVACVALSRTFAGATLVAIVVRDME